MARKTSCIVLLAVILAAIAPIQLRGVLANPTTWTVNDDGSADFKKIQDALNAASSGDTIFVYDGIYNENLDVTKSVSLLGANKETTVIDGKAVGTVIRITADNVIVANFTVRNAGKKWGPPPGSGFPDGCIIGEIVSNVQIVDNIFRDAAVCVWIAYSSSVNVSDNTVFGGIYGGIIGYSSSSVSMSRNLVDNCGLVGIHLDGYCTYCTIEENTVMSNVEGLELEGGPGANGVEDNTFINNNASIVLNSCGSLNVFRRNTMTNSKHHLVVFGYSLSSFLQDIDLSNLVDNKLVYYFTNLRDQGISPSACPNLGYLALVNCRNIAVKGFDVFGNGDGILVAYSTGCTFTNITVGGNHGPLRWGGFTFYNSSSNQMVDSRVMDNSYAVAFSRSEGNFFRRNLFIDNERQVISNFLNPFSPVSSEYISTNIWDDGAQGNFWSDYTGADANKDGVGDTPYIVDSRNVDHYPLISNASLPILDRYPPSIFILSPMAGENLRSSNVTVVWEGSDDVSGINNYEIRIDGGQWFNVFPEGPSAHAEHTFIGLSAGSHTVDIRAFDRVGNIREESVYFSVVTSVNIQLPPYLWEVVVAGMIIAAVTVAVYVLNMKGLLKRKAARGRLVR